MTLFPIICSASFAYLHFKYTNTVGWQRQKNEKKKREKTANAKPRTALPQSYAHCVPIKIINAAAVHRHPIDTVNTHTQYGSEVYGLRFSECDSAVSCTNDK